MNRFNILLIGMVLVTGCMNKVESPHILPKSLTPIAFNISGAPTVEISVPDMMCPSGCGVKTKEILLKQPGVKEVAVDFDAKTATVAIEEGIFDPQQAIASLVDYGFGNSQLKSAEAVPLETAPAR